jgi:ABC-2 type transport system permease protein
MTATMVSPDTLEAAPARRTVRPIPTTRLVTVEMRKMFNTRSGFWMLVSIGLLSVVATGAVIIFAPDSAVTYESFATAIGIPMSVILPMIAILSVTSEWSQRNGLTTFTFVPHRGRVIYAKLICSIGVGVVSMLLAAGIGAVGNIVGTSIAGVDLTWDVGLVEFGYIILANVLGMLVGFMLGVLIRNSAGAIVGYFVYSFLLPTLTMLLASSQQWFRDLQPWVDFNYAQSALFNETMTGEQWGQLGVTAAGWLLIPTVIGLWMVMRSEVK